VGLSCWSPKPTQTTLAGQEAARYLLAINSNDVATTGAEPRWLLVTALLPEAAPEDEVERIFADLKSACAHSGVSLVGGHTEITPGLERTILVGCLLGTVPRERLLRKSDRRPSDTLVLAGGIAIEGRAHHRFSRTGRGHGCRRALRPRCGFRTA